MLVSIAFIFVLINQINACNQRTFASGIVCVCNSDSCDSIPQVGPIAENNITVLFTSPSDPGFNEKNAAFGGKLDSSAITITVNDTQKFQKLFGFGGGFTDGVGINFFKLPTSLQDTVLKSYFGDESIGYTFGRVPIGGNDFSPRHYTLVDHEEDVNLERFSVQYEDLFYKIPVIHRAKNLLGNKTLNLVASAWTAPLWMKDKQIWNGGSVLKPEYYQLWADYHMKFFDEYSKYGLDFWGLTLGNSPSNGFMKYTLIPSMGWTTSEMAKYIKNNLGPTLRSSYYKHLKLMIHDDNLQFLPFTVPELFEDDEVLNYVDGVAMHWYISGSYLESMRKLAFTPKKETFVMETETCLFGETPDLGNWPRAAQYIDDIMLAMSYNYSAWLEWNLILNITGGPTLIDSPADGPIVINENYTEFYRQPTFYAIGHFSKYIIPDSIRLHSETSQYLRTIAFLRPDNIKVVSIFNEANNVISVQVKDEERVSSKIDIPAQSISTILYSA